MAYQQVLPPLHAHQAAEKHTHTHTHTMKQMLAVLQKMAIHTLAYTHTHSQIGLAGQRDHKLTPVVILPNGLSALTAAVNIAITHTCTRHIRLL